MVTHGTARTTVSYAAPGVTETTPLPGEAAACTSLVGIDDGALTCRNDEAGASRVVNADLSTGASRTTVVLARVIGSASTGWIELTRTGLSRHQPGRAAVPLPVRGVRVRAFEVPARSAATVGYTAGGLADAQGSVVVGTARRPDGTWTRSILHVAADGGHGAGQQPVGSLALAGGRLLTVDDAMAGRPGADVVHERPVRLGGAGQLAVGAADTLPARGVRVRASDPARRCSTTGCWSGSSRTATGTAPGRSTHWTCARPARRRCSPSTTAWWRGWARTTWSTSPDCPSRRSRSGPSPSTPPGRACPPTGTAARRHGVLRVQRSASTAVRLTVPTIAATATATATATAFGSRVPASWSPIGISPLGGPTSHDVRRRVLTGWGAGRVSASAPELVAEGTTARSMVYLGPWSAWAGSAVALDDTSRHVHPGPGWRRAWSPAAYGHAYLTTTRADARLSARAVDAIAVAID